MQNQCAQTVRLRLIYMQQRYYDPLAGRFLSVDPVTTDANTGGSFNRYAYALNSPYTYKDPDGQVANLVVKFIGDVAMETAIQYLTTGQVDIKSAAIESAKGMLNPAKTLEKVQKLAKIVDKGKDAAKVGGRHGGPAHRATVAGRAAELEKQGHTITAGGGKLPERSVITPEGNRRFPDISSRDASGNPYHENVGRSTASGDPIARERRALDDISRATGTEPGYTAYDR
jgi:RHS repeat-associated protein